MEDFEQVAQGLRTAPAKAALSQNDHLRLSHSEASVVARLPNSNEYNVILRIMEGEIEKFETEHMQAWKNKELFERTGLVAVAARSFYEKVQVEINYHASEFIGEMETAALERREEAMSPEEFIRRGFGIEE